jgi:inner membrane transporter RhtA
VLVLAPFTFRRWGGWSRRDYRNVAVFGAITAGMNMSFYVAIDHLPLGNGVAIEFIGPITVAALRTRSRRNALSLALATSGVIALSGTAIGDDAFGLIFIFLAAALWAGYIVYGAHVARQDRGVAGLSLGLVFGFVLTAPIGALDAGAVLGDSRVLVTALFVGVVSSAIPYTIDQHVLRRITVRRFAVLQALLPVVATVMAAIALDQRPSAVAAVGIALVVTAVAVQDAM